MPDKKVSFIYCLLNVFLSQLRKDYGDVYSIYLGTRPAVIVNGLQAIKEALVNKGAEFSGRPQDLFVNDARKGNGKCWFISYVREL